MSNQEIEAFHALENPSVCSADSGDSSGRVNLVETDFMAPFATNMLWVESTVQAHPEVTEFAIPTTLYQLTETPPRKKRPNAVEAYLQSRIQLPSGPTHLFFESAREHQLFDLQVPASDKPDGKRSTFVTVDPAVYQAVFGSALIFNELAVRSGQGQVQGSTIDLRRDLARRTFDQAQLLLPEISRPDLLMHLSDPRHMRTINENHQTREGWLRSVDELEARLWEIGLEQIADWEAMLRPLANQGIVAKPPAAFGIDNEFSMRDNLVVAFYDYSRRRSATPNDVEVKFGVVEFGPITPKQLHRNLVITHRMLTDFSRSAEGSDRFMALYNRIVSAGIARKLFTPEALYNFDQIYMRDFPRPAYKGGPPVTT